MAFTYSGDPQSSAKDEVRFLVGDTDTRDQLLQDAEISYLLSKYNNAPLNSAIRACEIIAAKFSRLCDEAVGQVRLSLSQKYKHYIDLRDALTARMAIEDCTPYAGGISVCDKETNAANPDRVKPDFTKHMMEDNQIAPWTTSQNIRPTEEV